MPIADTNKRMNTYLNVGNLSWVQYTDITAISVD